MGSDEHVRERQQSGEDIVMEHLGREIFEEEIAFLLVDVQTEIANRAGLQRINDRSGIDNRAAASVDEHDTWLHLLQRPGIDEAVGLGRQWTVQRHDVRAG